MTDIGRQHKALVSRVRDGDGHASRELRRAAFDYAGLEEPLRGLVDKVAHQAHTVNDDDVAAARAVGFSEDQIFEIVICAAVGQATRLYERGIAALEAATEGR